MSQHVGRWSVLTVTGIMTIILGAVMIGLSGASLLALSLGAGMLGMGLITTFSSMLNQSIPGPDPVPAPTGSQAAHDSAKPPAPLDHRHADRQVAGDLAGSFNRWLRQAGDHEQLWAGLDRWLRDAINEFLQGRRVRCYHVTESSPRLVPLADELESSPRSANLLERQALIDHVLVSGRCYLRGSSANGELIDRLALEFSGTDSGFGRGPDWLVPVRRQGRVIGLIVVGELPESVSVNSAALEAAAALLELCWQHVEITAALTIARRTDSASGVLTRQDLTAMGDSVLVESAATGEPVVVLAVSVEGVRRLDDQGRWELRDWLMREIGAQMRKRLRSDDLVGRFSDDRFVAVLRRLDISLGELIARKVLEGLKAAAASQPLITSAVVLRCGLAEADHGAFEPVLVRAFAALSEARNRDEDMLIDPPARRMASAAAGEASA